MEGVANGLGKSCEGTYVFPKKQSGLLRQRMITGMVFVVHRLQGIGTGEQRPTKHVFHRPLQKAHDSVDRTLPWEVFAWFRTLHGSMRARVQINGGELSAWYNNAFAPCRCSTCSAQPWWA